jgi:hypothetical protein
LLREETRVSLASVGKIFLLAAYPCRLDQVLNAGRAAPAAAVCLYDVRTQLAAFRLEAGIDRSIGRELIVMVPGDSSPQLGDP